MNTLQALLSQVTLVEARYKSQIKSTGENFNVFRILGVHTAEVRTHSAFLAEMLNPGGSHGQEGLFLRLFVQHLGFTDFVVEGATVEIERHIGAIDDAYLEGGRIDICIQQKSGYGIFIENKIYAADQKNQLLRYHNYSPDAKLIYLTLDGALPGKYSTGEALEQEAVLALSYAFDIVAWLEACRKEAATEPLVRETITQYINLIKHLTGQTTNKMMMEEIKKMALQSPDSLDGARQLGHAFNLIRNEIHDDLIARFDAAFKTMLPDGRVLFTYKGYSVKFATEYNSGDGYWYGFPAYDADGKGSVCKRSEFDELAAALRVMNGKFRRSNWWAGWINPPGFVKVESCSAQELFVLSTPEGREELVSRTVKEAAHYVEQLKLKFGNP